MLNIEKNKAFKTFSLISVFIILTLLILVGSGCSSSTKDPQPINNTQIYSSTEEALEVLDTITVSESENISYNRDDYGNWKEYSGWSTRDEVLSTGTNLVKNSKGTAYESGEWYIDYTDSTITCSTAKEVSSNLQIDHIVPVSYANQHGAYHWDEDKKQEFYNDYGQATKYTVGNNKTNDYTYVGNLVISDSKTNIQKSDKGPSQWLPSNKSYQKTYCEKWIKILSTWGLTISQADKVKIQEILKG